MMTEFFFGMQLKKFDRPKRLESLPRQKASLQRLYETNINT
jgi:hypothetical protein